MAKERVIEVDLLRTIAIVLMVAYHTAYDLLTVYGAAINLWGGYWETIRILTVSLFLFVSGVATNFSTKPYTRAATVLLYGMLISLITYTYEPRTFVYFGILHCIGIGMLILIPLKRLKELLILLGIAITLLPEMHAPRATVDFYPIVPWVGFMMIGAGIGHYLYKRNDLRLPLKAHPILTWPGRHALLLYLIHQPILLVVLALLHSR